MCLIAFQWQPEGPVPLILAGNRDEFYARPTAPMAWWAGGRILAGKDLKASGTWLGVAKDGRFAALTNFRDPRLTKTDRASRGQLPVRFLEGNAAVGTFLEQLRGEVDQYNPFNLLLFDGLDLLAYESRHDRIVPFAPGIHAVSNGDFDGPWPKVEALKAGLASALEDDEALLNLLGEAQPFPDDRLPSTGVSIEWERSLSPAFVRSPTYGTRASAVVRLGRDTVSILEQGFSPEGPQGRTEFQFQRR